jgi:hypothetical protein
MRIVDDTARHPGFEVSFVPMKSLDAFSHNIGPPSAHRARQARRDDTSSHRCQSDEIRQAMIARRWLVRRDHRRRRDRGDGRRCLRASPASRRTLDYHSRLTFNLSHGSARGISTDSHRERARWSAPGNRSSLVRRRCGTAEQIAEYDDAQLAANRSPRPFVLRQFSVLTAAVTRHRDCASSPQPDRADRRSLRYSADRSAV